MRTIAIIPARGGSKRIKYKNIKEIWGKPLIAYTIEASLKSKYVDETFVSTEDPQIKEIALKYGAEVIDRPIELAADDTKTEPVLFHAIEQIEKKEQVDNIVLLQATSPLRKAEDIDKAFEQFLQEKADSLVSVTEEYRLYWKDGKPINYSLESYMDRPRLSGSYMEPMLKENGAIYICKKDVLLKNKNRVGGKIAVFKMSDETEIELDTRTDWAKLQQLNSHQKIGENGVYVIAEVGCNHQGDIDIAKRMIEVAKYCGVDAVKFQKRDIKTLLTPEQYNKIYDNPNSFGKTYGEHREKLELSFDEHMELKEYAQNIGLTYFVSVWDKNSAIEMLEIGSPVIKIPSASITDQEIWTVLNKAGIPILASVGMSTLEEIDKLVEGLKEIKDLFLLQCTSTYPCDFKDINLNVIPLLQKRYAGKIKGVGFSGHHLGIAIDLAAVAMGATVIERHFTLDRTWKGTDHAASLEPEGMRRLVRDIRAFEKAKGDGVKQRLECEKTSWEKLRKVK